MRRVILAVAIAWVATTATLAAEKPVKVFIFCGQSNMQGHAKIPTLDWIGKDKTQSALLDKIKGKDGEWRVREGAWIHYLREKGGFKHGPLTVGYGADDTKVGPELMMGAVLDDHYGEQLLLIKCAWGGKSLMTEFRPPSAGGEVGPYYTKTVEIVKEALANIGEDFPAYKDQGYEIVGFAWFQGWNDMIKQERVDVYEENLVHFIKDMRKDLDAPKMPFVIGELGAGGRPQEGDRPNPRKAQFQQAQAETADPKRHPEFEGNVAFVPTVDLWDYEAAAFLKKNYIKRKFVSEEAKIEWNTMGSNQPYHYMGSGKVYSKIGAAMGEALIKLNQ